MVFTSPELSPMLGSRNLKFFVKSNLANGATVY